MIKNILKEANAYDGVVSVLIITATTDFSQSIPINPYIDQDGNTIWRIDGTLIAKEASKLLKLIEEDNDIEIEKSVDDFENLYHFIKTNANIFLHNYSISISHRKTPEIDMDKIRLLLIIESFLTSIGINDYEWEIPEGWKILKN